MEEVVYYCHACGHYWMERLVEIGLSDCPSCGEPACCPKSVKDLADDDNGC